MRKFILAIVALLGLAGPCLAAFAIFQTYTPPPPSRVQVNLGAAPYNAACDAQTGTRVVSITSGTPNLSVSTNTFTSGDVGKRILVPGAGTGSPNLLSTTILAFVDPQNVTLAANAVVTLTASSQYLTWATNDTSAFLAFKAAYQGATPVQLNLPGNCSFLPAFGSPNAWPFDGITDLVVAGNGSATSAIVSLNGGFLLGTRAQYADSAHSVRTDTANAGDSCVILKTSPAVTVSDVQNNLPVPATFTAAIPAASTTMTVTAMSSGTIGIGAYLTNRNSNITSFTSVTAQLTGTGGATCPDPTCNGTTGTYSISQTQSAGNLASQIMTTVPATFTATVDAAGVMNVTAVTDGALAVGMYPYRQLGIIGAPNAIKAQLSGSAGGVGTYQLSYAPLPSQVASLATPSGFIGNGQIRVTLNSTTGLTSGDTLYLSGMTGFGQLPQRMNNLSWIKVVNSTQVDLFQRDFNGLYNSGGSGGGDRTSLFPTGAKVLMTGWVNQAYWAQPYGQPTNPHFFEYKTVVSNNPTTHQVCFDTPLANTYKDTWPQFNTGSNNEMDPGGPATLYVYPTSWDATIVFRDLTIDNYYGQSYSQGRNVTFQDAKFTGSHCPVPTQNETINWVNVDATNCNIETDKIVKTWNISGSTARLLTIQSSSFGEINVTNSSFVNWAGSPRKLNITNTTIANGLQVGTAAYGTSDESICTNCNITTSFSIAGAVQQVNAANRQWSMSGGVITIPNAYSYSSSFNEGETQTRVFAPGSYFYWRGGGGGGTVAQVGRVVKVIDATQDLDNIYIQTSEAGGFPTGAWTTNGLSVAAHPAPKLTVSFVGSPPNNALVMNGCPAQAPIYSCANFVYTGSATGASADGFGPTIWGVLDTFTFTNNVPYTNTGSLSWTPTVFGNIQVLKTDLTTTSWGVSQGSGGMVNMKLPSTPGGGTRTLTQSGLTGGQTLDNISPPPTDGWIGTSMQPRFTANTPSDSPQVTMQLRTNQQLPP